MLKKKRKQKRNLTKIRVNREHKDRLFRLIFGREENKQNLLDLYNALNNTRYSELADLEITTLEDVIYMGMKNDVSMLIHSRMSLYEHQSTYNPNMPIRGFMYNGKLYGKYIEKNNLNIYGKKLVKLPVPQYVVFYNGDDDHNDEEILRLSDAFEGNEKPDGYEWTARMININYGRNRELMENCKPLRDYSILVDKIKRYTKEIKNIEKAVDRAISECIAEDVLTDFLRKHRAEVKDVCITEYNEERVMDAMRTDAFEDGHSLGLQEGHSLGLQEGQSKERIHGIKNLIQVFLDYGDDIDTAVTKTAERYHVTEQEIRDILESK